MSMPKDHKKCFACKGTKKDPRGGGGKCPVCKGSGSVHKSLLPMKLKKVSYKGAIYMLAVEKKTRPQHVLYTLHVQPPKSKAKDVEVNKLLVSLIGRSPDHTEEDFGSIEHTWGCESEAECERHQKAIHQKFPGAIVDFHPAV